ncbi:alpha-amylase, partial [bacterium]
QYYWHRFYHHQPDLNYESLEVQNEILKIADFWFNLGVDGMRLDAIPYLYAKEGTNSENLPETHVYLKKLRKHVDDNHPGKMLLAEANQWPEDVIEYFGDGDECHMAFNFPVMPRMYMSIKMEDSFPLIDIINQTPKIPDNCQWAIFLRNHDELTLEMVTDEERDYMYKVFANDTKARINLGIRRRLAPLIDNNRSQIELLNVMLFSLPGSPILYYGDEIGMGDNYYLGDRNGVRTPMQWNANKNAGFSSADPEALFLPTISNHEYHYETINVEKQENKSGSLLHFTRRIIALRKRYKAFSRGTFDFIQTSNSKVLVYLRKFEDENILVVVNLSRYAQTADIYLNDFKDYTPQEMFSKSNFSV